MEGHGGDHQALPDLFRQLDAHNRENIARAGLGIRTSADIFEAAQRQCDEARVEKPSAAGDGRHFGAGRSGHPDVDRHF